MNLENIFYKIVGSNTLTNKNISYSNKVSSVVTHNIKHSVSNNHTRVVNKTNTRNKVQTINKANQGTDQNINNTQYNKKSHNTKISRNHNSQVNDICRERDNISNDTCNDSNAKPSTKFSINKFKNKSNKNREMNK